MKDRIKNIIIVILLLIIWDLLPGRDVLLRIGRFVTSINSEDYNNFASGTGLLLAGIAGGLLLWDRLKEVISSRRAEYLKSNFRLMYPNSEVDKTFKLIASRKTAPKIFILKDNKTRWIENSQTFRDLGFTFGQVKEIKDEEMDSYELIKEGIRTRGEPWT